MLQTKEYTYNNVKPTWANGYLWPIVQNIIAHRIEADRNGIRAFDLGCGNGATTNMLSGMGFDPVGVDTSVSGINLASAAHPHCKFEIASAYDDLAAAFGKFKLVVSLEVIEHLYDPRLFARRVFDLLEPGGLAIISTPYHSYWKNVALAITGNLDRHFTALWDGGHIKFFSEHTITALLAEASLERVDFFRVGRLPILAKSMIVVVRKPSSSVG